MADEKRTFLQKREPGANTSAVVPVVHLNPNSFMTFAGPLAKGTTSTSLYQFVETSTHPDDSFDNYESFTMDDHTYSSVPDISEEFLHYRARKRQLDQIDHREYKNTDVQSASGIPAFLSKRLPASIFAKLATFLCGLMPYTPQGLYPIFFFLAIFIVGFMHLSLIHI